MANLLSERDSDSTPWSTFYDTISVVVNKTGRHEYSLHMTLDRAMSDSLQYCRLLALRRDKSILHASCCLGFLRFLAFDCCSDFLNSIILKVEFLRFG